MKKLIPLLIISTLILSGCGGSKNNIPQSQSPQQSQVQDGDEEMSWFEDEVLDMDDWGEKKKSKVKPKTDTSKSVKATTPSKPVTPKSNTKSSTSTSKKKI